MIQHAVSWRGRTTSPTEHDFRVYLLDIFIDLKQQYEFNEKICEVCPKDVGTGPGGCGGGDNRTEEGGVGDHI